MPLSQRIGGNLKLLRESTYADRKRLKLTFSIANWRFWLPICNLKRCFNAYRPALLESRDSSRLPHIRCVYRLRRISCCEPIINIIAQKSGVLYITVLLIAEKNKGVW